MKCSGLVPETVAVNAVNASCEIILLFWDFGSGVYVIFWVHLLSLLAAMECPFVPIWPLLSLVLMLHVQACVELTVFRFFFCAVLTLFLARLPLEDSY